MLGWSLNFEMFFYLWFALALKLKPGVIAPIVCARDDLRVHARSFTSLGVDNAILTFWARPIVLEFVFGIGVFYLFTWEALKPPKAAADRTDHRVVRDDLLRRGRVVSITIA